MANEKKIKDIEDLWDKLGDVFVGLGDGSVDIKVAESQINAAGKMIKATMVALVAERTGSKIAFLTGGKCQKQLT